MVSYKMDRQYLNQSEICMKDKRREDFLKRKYQIYAYLEQF